MKILQNRALGKTYSPLLTLLLILSLIVIGACGGEEAESEDCENQKFDPATEGWICLDGQGSSDTGPKSGNSTALNESANAQEKVDSNPKQSSKESVSPTPTPSILNSVAATQEVWVHLSKCVSLGIEHLEAQEAPRDEWLILPTEYSPQEFGTWKVSKWSTSITPHNNVAKSWDEYIKGNCDTSILSPAATDVLDENDAATVLWTQLAKCNPELPVEMLTARKNQETGDYVVVSDAKYTGFDDFGVWSVARNADIKPLNERAEQVLRALFLSEEEIVEGEPSSKPSELAAGCNPVIRTAQEAKNKIYAYLAPCHPKLGQNEITTTRDPVKHVWIVVTQEPPVDNTAEAKGSVWSINGSGMISPLNSSSRNTQVVIENKKC